MFSGHAAHPNMVVSGEAMGRGSCFPRSPSARDLGHPDLWREKIAESGGSGFVLSHPSAEKSGWMGHADLWREKIAESGGLGFVLSHPSAEKSGWMGHAIFVGRSRAGHAAGGGKSRRGRESSSGG